MVLLNHNQLVVIILTSHSDWPVMACDQACPKHYQLSSHLRAKPGNASHWKPSGQMIHVIIHKAIKQDESKDRHLAGAPEHSFTHSFVIFLSIQMTDLSTLCMSSTPSCFKISCDFKSRELKKKFIHYSLQLLSSF